MFASTPSPSSPGADSSDVQRRSKDSEGYPSWLPKRPPPPAPASTFHSSHAGTHNDLDDVVHVDFGIRGRKPTPRSVRIVSLQDELVAGAVGAGTVHNVNTRLGALPRTSPAVFASPDGTPSRTLQPRFRARGLNLSLLRSPSPFVRFYYFLFPFIVFAHIPLQTFFDFNAVFILIQVSKFPNPQAPGIPGSGKNWALGAAAYIASWFVWIFIVFILYEVIYSFVRRWRVKRPLILPIYLSAPAYNLVSLTSYQNFCFLLHIRLSAFSTDAPGSFRDAIAESLYHYSQNLPTVALLLPRGGLSFALLLAFGSPLKNSAQLTGVLSRRDGTFFRDDGALSGYAKGVLAANAAWTAWRVLVLIASWVGLWLLSGHRLAGISGPRHRWQEESHEKRRSLFSASSLPPLGVGDAQSLDEVDVLPWKWRECTRLRVVEAYEFCLMKGYLRWSSAGAHISADENEKTAAGEEAGQGLSGGRVEETMDMDDPEIEQVQRALAAAGFPSSIASPSRRGALSQELFVRPTASPSPLSPSQSNSGSGTGTPLGKGKGKAKAKGKAKKGTTPPQTAYPYPFVGGSAQVSSEDSVAVPFPAEEGSPVIPQLEASDRARSGTSSNASESGTTTTTTTSTNEGTTTTTTTTTSEESDEQDDDDDDEEEEEEEDNDHPSTGHASGSLSSLGRPISPRYPFGFRVPSTGRGSVSLSLSSEGAASGVHSINQGVLANPNTGVIHAARQQPGAGARSVASSRVTAQSGLSAVTRQTAGSGGTGIESVPSRTRSMGSLSTGNAESEESAGSGASSILRGGERELRAASGGSHESHGTGNTDWRAIPMPPPGPRRRRRERERAETVPSQAQAQQVTRPQGPRPRNAQESEWMDVAVPVSVRIRVRPPTAGEPVVFPSLRGQRLGQFSRDDNERHDDDDEGHDARSEHEEDDEDPSDELEDRVGLLGVSAGGTGSAERSRGSSLVRSRTGSAASGGGAGSTNNRSRASSFAAGVRSRAESLLSVGGSHNNNNNARSRAASNAGGNGNGRRATSRTRTESLGAGVRSRAQSLLSAAAASLEAVRGVALRVGGGISVSPVGGPMVRLDNAERRHEFDEELQPEADELATADTSINSDPDMPLSDVDAPHPFVDLRRELGYYSTSSGGTHSRSGSESVSAGENYTFGRPVAFLRAQQMQQRIQEQHGGEDVREEVEAEREVESEHEHDHDVEESLAEREAPSRSSLSVDVDFYSLRASDHTASPGLVTPIPGHGSEAETERERSVEREGMEIPVPIVWRVQGEEADTSVSTSPPDVSSAAGSFVTAPATVESATSTGSSGGRTIGSLEGAGMVVRENWGPGGGGAWRVV